VQAAGSSGGGGGGGLDQATADTLYVKLPGDTMTGKLTINAMDGLEVIDPAATWSRVKTTAGASKWSAGASVTGFGINDETAGVPRLAIDLATGNATFSGTVTTSNSIINTGTITSTATITSNTDIVSTAGHVSSKSNGGNANHWMLDAANASRAVMYWAPATDRLVFARGDSTAPTGFCEIHPSGLFYSSYGYQTKSGIASLPTNYASNIDSSQHLWIDAVDLGQIAFASDYRIKKDVVDLPAMWDAVKALRPIKYTQAAFSPPSHSERAVENGEPLFKADSIERWGFLAHELQATLTPSAANGVKDDPAAIQSPNPFTIIAALTKALQETMTRLEAVEAQLAVARR